MVLRLRVTSVATLLNNLAAELGHDAALSGAQTFLLQQLLVMQMLPGWHSALLVQLEIPLQESPSRAIHTDRPDASVEQ